MSAAREEVVRRQGAIVPFGDDSLRGGTALDVIARVEDLGIGWVATAIPQPLQPEAFHGEYVYLMRESGGEISRTAETCLLLRSDRVDSMPGARYLRDVRRKAPDLTVYRASADVVAAYLRAHTLTARRGSSNTSRVSLAEQRAYDLYRQAIAANASDIHIEVVSQGRYAPQVLIRMRVDGVLVQVDARRSPEDLAAVEEMIRTMYQHPDYSNEQEREPSTFAPGARCKCRLTPPIQGLVLRFESDPTVSGYSVALRLLQHRESDVARKTLEGLGLSSYQAKSLYRASLVGDGLILVMGETGSGKTTTIATLLELDPNKHSKKRISLENPPEMDIESISQFRVSNDTLPDVAVGVVRQDPDVIYVGEINDPITAGIAQSMALTGHTTFGTFHANNCVATFQRLTSDGIGMDATVLGTEGFLRALLFQKLLPRLCPDCRVPAERVMDSEDLQLLRDKFGIDTSQAFVANKCTDGEHKCPRCNGNGEVGRVLLAELIVPDRRFLELIMAKRFNDANDHYRRQRVSGFAKCEDTRGKTWREHALGRAANGQLCMQRVWDMEVWENYELVELNERAPGARR